MSNSRLGYEPGTALLDSPLVKELLSQKKQPEQQREEPITQDQWEGLAEVFNCDDEAEEYPTMTLRDDFHDVDSYDEDY